MVGSAVWKVLSLEIFKFNWKTSKLDLTNQQIVSDFIRKKSQR